MGEETLEGQGSKRKISSSEDDLIRCGKKKIHSGRYFVAIGKNVGRRKKRARTIYCLPKLLFQGQGVEPEPRKSFLRKNGK